MPIYEFECPQCRHRFEWLAFSSREKSPACPCCRNPETWKRPSVFSNTAHKAEGVSGGTSRAASCAPAG